MTRAKPATVNRPSTKAKLAAVLEGLRTGLTRSQACDVLGLGRTTFYQAMEDDPEFAALVLQAEAEAVQHWTTCIYNAAPRHWQAAAWMLERRFPETYGPRASLELSGSSGGPLAVILAQAAAMTPEQQDAELRKLLDTMGPFLEPSDEAAEGEADGA